LAGDLTAEARTATRMTAVLVPRSGVASAGKPAEACSALRGARREGDAKQ